MKRPALFIMALLLAGCEITAHNDFSDCKSGLFNLEIVIAPREEIEAMWLKALRRTPDKNYGVQQLLTQGYVARTKAGAIRMYLPKVEDPLKYQAQLDTWGHELAHVVCGEWHR